jgi:phosphatidylglycerol:prolipoprotein diacylglycerol transferase
MPWGGTVTIASYGAMVLVGFLACLWLAQGRGRRLGIDPLALFDAATFGLLGGIVGARAFYVLDNWAAFAGNPWRILRIDLGGLTFYGGLAGGAAGFLAAVRKRRLPVRLTLDVAASVMPLGHALGRVGCFLNGCCFGKVTSAWTGVRFPRIVDATNTLVGSLPYMEQLQHGLITETQTRSLPVHPTQLYEAAYNLAIFAVLSLLFTRRRRPGDIGWLYLVLYGASRFTNEFFRADTAPVASLGGLTIFQAISAAAVLLGVAMLVDSLRRPRLPLPDPWQPPAEVKANG